jgi:CheY-like chemotaxis protein
LKKTNSSNSRACILVVEDDQDIREIVLELIESLGFDTKSAMNGRVALEILYPDRHRQTGRFDSVVDAVFSDIRMPLMNGFELLSQLRKLNFNQPFVLMTADPSKENRDRAFQLGAFDFIKKPFEIETLRRTLSRAAQIGIEKKASLYPT